MADLRRDATRLDDGFTSNVEAEGPQTSLFNERQNSLRTGARAALQPGIFEQRAHTLRAQYALAGQPSPFAERSNSLRLPRGATSENAMRLHHGRERGEGRDAEEAMLAGKDPGAGDTGANAGEPQGSLRVGIGAASVDIGVLPTDVPPNFEGLLSGNLDGDQHGSGHNAVLGVLAALIGTVLEFYDFSVYAFFAPEIGKLFFPKGDATLRAVQTFSVFAGGFLMRPLGSLVLGWVGDRWGTGVALKWSIALMCIPTVVTGCLPTHKQIGHAATGLLVACRLLQGMSVGGELIGAILHTSDAKMASSHRGFYCGLVAACGAVGNLLGSAVSTVVHRVLPEATILTWGWRVPFMCGAALGLVGLLLRTQGKASMSQSQARGVQSTAAPIVRQRSTSQPSLLEAWQQLNTAHRLPDLCLVMLLGAVFSILFYTNCVWLGTYLSSLAEHRIDPFYAFGAVCSLQAMVVVSVPFFGYLGDLYKPRLAWLAAGLLIVVIAQPLLWTSLLQSGDVTKTFIYSITMGLAVGFAMSGNWWGWVTETLKDLPNRYLSISVAYNIGAIVGGAYPMIASALTASDMKVAPMLPMVALGVPAFLCVLLKLYIETRDAAKANQKTVDVEEGKDAVRG